MSQSHARRFPARAASATAAKVTPVCKPDVWSDGAREPGAPVGNRQQAARVAPLPVGVDPVPEAAAPPLPAPPRRRSRGQPEAAPPAQLVGEGVEERARPLSP